MIRVIGTVKVSAAIEVIGTTYAFASYHFESDVPKIDANQHYSLHYKVGTEGEYTIESRNGRPFDDNAMSVALMFTGEPIDDLVDPVPTRQR